MEAAAEMQNLLLAPPDGVDLTQRQEAAERSVSANRSQVHSDHTRARHGTARCTEGDAHFRSETHRKDLKAKKALPCETHDRQRVKDAVKPLRGCGVRVVRVVHAALLRVQVRVNGRSGAPVPAGLETPSLWTHTGLLATCCPAEILKDISGHLLFKIYVFLPSKLQR
ncbi:hypothetical protein PFLUV_G00076680 [Perca fluviatilis]|uniref:Uncharacterized protein n=1 Tax=Perca fluviatilis TaxID=8168 RepID=A0A6A5FI36_PERFL|nr:hypothetical protein PFLUV_G00076680 [Perca fluviatilis]